MENIGSCWFAGGVCLYGYHHFSDANKVVCRGCYHFNCYWRKGDEKSFKSLAQKNQKPLVISRKG